MKNYFTFLTALILVSSPLLADTEYVACSRWYMGGIFGVSQVNSDFDAGPQLGLSIGYRLSRSIRLEGELSASINRYKGTDLDLNTGLLMANILYDFNLRPIRPYVGFGVGSLHRSVTIEFDEMILRVEDNAFAYQGIFGLMIPVSSNAFASLEYRYVENSENLNITQSLGLIIKRYF